MSLNGKLKQVEVFKMTEENKPVLKLDNEKEQLALLPYSELLLRMHDKQLANLVHNFRRDPNLYRVNDLMIYCLDNCGSAFNAMLYGHEKYGKKAGVMCSYLGVRPPVRYLSALVRHSIAIAEGETCDQESGFTHGSHITANAGILYDVGYELNFEKGWLLSEE